MLQGERLNEQSLLLELLSECKVSRLAGNHSNYEDNSVFIHFFPADPNNRVNSNASPRP
jgi:hypothetical protein